MIRLGNIKKRKLLLQNVIVFRKLNSVILKITPQEFYYYYKLASIRNGGAKKVKMLLFICNICALIMQIYIQRRCHFSAIIEYETICFVTNNLAI